MGGTSENIVKEQIRRNLLLNALTKGIRFDGRTYDKYREVTIKKGVISAADGSAYASIGNTKVVSAIKFEIVSPYPDNPEEGVLVTSADFLPLASRTFDVGPNWEEAVELARSVDRAVRSSKAVDLSSFFIEEGKVLGMYIDIYITDYCGNAVDCSSFATLAALTNTLIPRIENGKLVRGEGKQLSLACYPLTTTFGSISDFLIVDPSKEEEDGADGKLIVGTTDKHVVAIQKSGAYAITKEELGESIDIAFKKSNEIRKIIMG